MAAHEVQHQRWGSNLANQISGHIWKGKGNDGPYNVTIEEYKGVFGGTKTREKREHVGFAWFPADDENKEAKRRFRHRCGLLRIVMTPHSKGPLFVVFLDGHVTSNFVSDEMEFRFAPEVLKENDGKPIAEVWFHGKGKRHGPLRNYGTSRIVCIFADKEQMDQYIDLNNRRMPKFITHQGVTYNATGGGEYKSNDGVSLNHLLVMYFLLMPHEQKAFAAHNPEVESLLGGTAQDAVVGGVSQTDHQASTAEADSGGESDQSDDSDYRSSDASGDSGSAGGNE